MKAAEIARSCAEVLQDVKNVTWTADQILEWINDALRQLVAVRPDAITRTSSITLTASETRQSITGRRLIDVTRNMGVNGTTIGNNIRKVNMQAKDAFEPGWHAATPAAAVEEWMYEPDKDPTVFFVSPPVHASTVVQVEVVEAIDPTALTDVSDNLPTKDVYSPALINWVLYRCLSRDSEKTPNYSRAKGEYQAFYNALGVKIPGDKRVSPKKEKSRQQ